MSLRRWLGKKNEAREKLAGRKGWNKGETLKSISILILKNTREKVLEIVTFNLWRPNA